MTAGELAAVTGGLLVAGAMWVFMFRLDRSDIWPRTWVAAGVVSSYAIGAAVALGHARQLVGSLSLRELLVGVAVGGAWLVATHLGATVLGWIVPGFLDEIAELYRLADGDTAARIAGPLVAMAVAEELLFRGLIQGRAGLVVAVIACTRQSSSSNRSGRSSWPPCSAVSCGAACSSGDTAWWPPWWRIRCGPWPSPWSGPFAGLGWESAARCGPPDGIQASFERREATRRVSSLRALN